MFRAPLCLSSRAHDGSVGYHIGRLVRREPDGVCGNERYLRELLIVALQPSVRTLIHPACT